MKTPNPQSLALSLGCAAVLAAGAPATSLAFGNPGVLPPESMPYGLSYGDWGARWWQWIYSFPYTNNPGTDTNGAYAAQGQSGPVWFLAGTFGGPAVTRAVTVPGDKAIFLPLLSYLNDYPCPDPNFHPLPSQSLQDFLTYGDTNYMGAETFVSLPDLTLEADLDGVTLANLTDFKGLSPLITFTADASLVPVDSCLTGKPQSGVSDGYWLMLNPLSPGPHQLHFRTTIPSMSFLVEVTYNLEVTPAITPPASMPCGLSCGEWGARWWQWLYSIPYANNPNADTTGAYATLGQSGPVWFLAGTFGGPAVSRSITVPFGKSIFFPIVNYLSDFPCPCNGANFQPDNGQSLQDFLAYGNANFWGASNYMAVPDLTLEAEVDGVALANLTNYQALSSLFTFTADPSLSQADCCVSGSLQYGVSDGYWIMLNPLPAGPHTIHFKATIPSFSFAVEVTDHLVVTPSVAPPTATVYGRSYADWSAAWWEWLYKLPVNQNPMFLDGNLDLSLRQPDGPVWFLGGMMVISTEPNAFVGVAHRTGTVPAGKALFFPILNSELDNPTTPNPDGTFPGTYSTDELKAMNQALLDTATGVACEIDGVSVANLSNPLTTPYRIVAPVFDFWLPSYNNIEQFWGMNVSGWISNAVSDGVFLMLDPLPAGQHTIHFTGTFPNSPPVSPSFKLDITYNLTVVDQPPVAAPDSTPYGLSYAQWSARHWQWLYSAPVPQNPLFMDGLVDLSLNQPDGPVWFLGGTCNTIQTPTGYFGAATRTGTVPAGKALFFPILDCEWDNPTTAAPDGTYPGSYTTDQLRGFARADTDAATNLICEIDGVPLLNLTNSLTTPYRAASPMFDFCLPTYENVEQFWGFTGLSGWVSNAVADGVFVMLKPLPVGPHTIHIAGSVPPIPSLGAASFGLDVTYHLTVSDSPPPIASPTSTAYGLSYADWSAKHWQWLYSARVNTNQLALSPNPLFLDGNVDLGLHQPAGPVWFLGGMMVLNTVQVTNFIGQATRSGTVPAGKAIFFPILDAESDNPTTPDAITGLLPGHYTTDQLRGMARATMDSATGMACQIDGVPVPNLSASLTTPYRVASPAFDFWLPAEAPPQENVIQYWGMDVKGEVAGAVADGAFLMLQPLPVGPHTIHLAGSIPGNPSFSLDITYHLAVVPVLTFSLGSNGSLSISWDPSAVPAGFVLESTADLQSPQWTPVIGTQGNQMVVQASATRQFYRLHQE